MTDDGHDTNCTFRKCAHPESPEPCPFVRDEQDMLTVSNHVAVESHRPEWRQVAGLTRQDGPWFYCIHCKKIEQ
jgi:hypothetical protein